MTDQDYVDFCNCAFDLRKAAEAFFAKLSDEQVYQLDGLVRMEKSAPPKGEVELGYDFLAAILAEEVEVRKSPLRNVVTMPRRFDDGLPF